MLTDAQIAQFHTNGYLLGGRVLSDEQVDLLRAELKRVIDEGKTGTDDSPVLLRNLGKPESPVWQIVNIWHASEPFRALVLSDQIGQEIAQLTGSQTVRVWHDQIQYKPAGAGGVNMWHQDAPYWPSIEPMTQVSAWVALDDVDASNGCMSMVSGSHKWGNQIEFIHTLKSFDAMPSEWNGHRVEVKLCPVKKGHVHFHHALTWHGSHANTSDRPRRAIAIHFINEQTRFVRKGGHPMEPYIQVPIGEVLEGEHFPVVWSRNKR